MRRERIGERWSAGRGVGSFFAIWMGVSVLGVGLPGCVQEKDPCLGCGSETDPACEQCQSFEAGQEVPTDGEPLVCREECCMICDGGQPCGDACISWRYVCHQPPGCACLEEELCANLEEPWLEPSPAE